MSVANPQEITYWCLGGTGINLGDAIKQHTLSAYNKAARFIGLDASEANVPSTGFHVDRITLPADPTQVAKGSGKIQSKNYDAAQPFIDKVMSNHGAGMFNVVVCNLAGGTGSMLSVLVLRWLKRNGHHAVGLFVGDRTTQVEFGNSISTLTFLANQVKPELLNVPIPYVELWNTVDDPTTDPKKPVVELTRGQVNRKVVEKADLLSIFMTEANGEMDYEDIKNTFEYSKYGVAPALSRITFLNQTAFAKEEGYTGRLPVAVASLFNDSDSVVPRFKGAVSRSTGVFADSKNRPAEVTELHMLLDHGDAVRDLEAHIKKLGTLKAQNNETFAQQKDISAGKPMDANGMSFG